MTNEIRIRLARWGLKRNPFYGLVVANSTKARDGKHIERLGTYNPIPQPEPEKYQKYLLEKGPGSRKVPPVPVNQKHVQLNIERIKFWIGNGATLSSRASWILAKAGLIPQNPIQNQRNGKVQLSDPTTWPVAIKDNQGKVIAVMSREEAINQYKKQGDAIHPDLIIKTLPSFDFSKVQLDKPPKSKLTEKERLTLLQQIAGIE